MPVPVAMKMLSVNGERSRNNPCGPCTWTRLSHLQIAQQVREEPALHAIDAHVKLVAARRRCDGVGPGLLLSRRVQGHGGDELARLEIELLQLFDSEFKMETIRAF